MTVVAARQRVAVPFSRGRGPGLRRQPAGSRRVRRAVAGLLPVLVTGLALTLGAGPARAESVAPVPLGVDVSYPQCGGRLPSHAFALVGVNGGLPTTTNPCLAVQLKWGQQALGGTVNDDVQLYVNTANPGRLGVASWPRSGVNRYGACHGADSRACAYQYGWNRAREDATVRGIRHPQQYMWWLDVETGNSWDYSSGGRVRNAAVLEGMTNYFTAIRSRGVGLYSTHDQWERIVGDAPRPTSSLNGLSNWRPAGSTLTDARAACRVAPLTPGGTIEMTQYTAGLDYNYSCI